MIDDSSQSGTLLTNSFQPPIFCHASCLGRKQRKLFLRTEDYQTYFRLINVYKRKFGIRVFGFCLMPMVAQMVLQATNEDDLSRFLSGVSRAYAIYIQIQYDLQKNPWQSFKLLYFTDMQDLLKNVRDMERDPVKAKLTDAAVKYPWSSCFYRILRERHTILDPISMVS